MTAARANVTLFVRIDGLESGRGRPQPVVCSAIKTSNTERPIGDPAGSHWAWTCAHALQAEGTALSNFLLSPPVWRQERGCQE